MTGIKENNTNIFGLIFSKDRAMQLHAVLESLNLHCRDSDAMTLHVLYRISSTAHRRQYARLKDDFANVVFIEEADFRSQVLDIVGSCRHILFLVDDNIFTHDFTLAEVTSALADNPDSLGFSLRLGTNINYSYMKDAHVAQPLFESVSAEVVKFDWTEAAYDFGYPLELSSSVYRTADILPLIGQVSFSNPNTFEGMMAVNAAIFGRLQNRLLSFRQSVTFCNPLNLVQDVCDNRVSVDQQYSARHLSEMFGRDIRIDVARLAGLVPNACHQEIELEFITAPATSAPDVSIAPNGTNAPLVSVEMVTYNTERFIGGAIESVLAQSYGNFELVIVDDGSDDDTEQIVSSYTDSRIRYIRQPHRNAATARNTAITHAKGDYILVVDSDDFIDADYIKDVLGFAEQYPDADFYYPSELTLVDESDQPTGAEWRYEDYTDSAAIVQLLFKLGKSVIPNPGSLIRKSLFERVGLYEDLDTVEDYVFLCKNALDIRFRMVPRHSSYQYRCVATSLSRRFDSRNEITAAALNDMIGRYEPQVLCPQLSQPAGPDMRRKQYFEYLMMTFYSLAQVNHGRCAKPFRLCGDYYRTRMLNAIAESRLPTGSAWTLTGRERSDRMYREAIDNLKGDRPDEALVFLGQIDDSQTELQDIDYARAVAFAQLGRDDQAQTACREQLHATPDHQRALKLLRQLLSKINSQTSNKINTQIAQGNNHA